MRGYPWCPACGSLVVSDGPPQHCRECGSLDIRQKVPPDTDAAFARMWRQADPAAAFREFVRKNDRAGG